MVQEWRLSLQGHDEKINGPSLTVGPVLSDEEYREIDSSISFLLGILDDSPYFRLKEEYGKIRVKINEIAKSIEDRNHNPKELKEISKLIDNYLFAFRAFEDRTKHYISKKYGKESEHFLVFDKALSDEYDNNFAYRFSCQLRNCSQHTGATISGIESGGDISGNVYCNPVFNSKCLLEQYDKWNKRVKEDLSQINGDFSAITVADSLMLSCTKAYSKLAIASETEILSAIEIIDKYTVNASEKTRPILISLERDAAGRTDYKQLTIKDLRIDLAMNARSVLSQARTFVK
jgi:hypothetical protein